MCLHKEPRKKGNAVGWYQRCEAQGERGGSLVLERFGFHLERSSLSADFT